MSACDTCANKGKRCVPGSGPMPARVMLIGAYPGPEEAKRGEVFVGRTGKELDGQYLRLAGLFRPQCYVTNVYKCLPEGEAGDEDILACAREWLPQELEAVQPEVVVLMGADACLLDPGIDLERHHGLPRMGELFGHPAILFPTYHPAAGLHETEWMTPLREDFAGLGRVLRGELDWMPHDLFGERVTYYVYRAGMRGAAPVVAWEYWVALDTESVRGVPYCVTASGCPGEALLIDADDHESLRVLAELIDRCRLLVVLHHAGHDLPVLAALGIRPRRWTDTMIRAYHLGLPQALKVLAYRLCGMEMQDYQDVIAPYAQERMVAYLVAAHDALVPLDEFLKQEGLLLHVSGGGFQQPFLVAPDQDVEWLFGRGKEAISVSAFREMAQVDSALPRRMASVRRRLTRLIGDCGAAGVNPWKRWAGWPGEERALIVEAVGELPPAPGIDQVPRELAVRYACRDADATGRVYLELVRRARELRRTVRVSCPKP